MSMITIKNYESKDYDFTNPQKSIWVLEQFYKNTPVNNICGTLVIHDCVNFDNLLKAVKFFVETNDCFKIRLHFDKNNEIKQYFSDSYKLDCSNIALFKRKWLIFLFNLLILNFLILNFLNL